VTDVTCSGSLFGNLGLCNASLCVGQFQESHRLADTASTVGAAAASPTRGCTSAVTNFHVTVFEDRTDGRIDSFVLMCYVAANEMRI
jgi:hypothetical protein